MKSLPRIHRAWRLSPETDRSIKKWSKVLGISETQFVESTIQIIAKGLEESATHLKTRVSPLNSLNSTQNEEKNNCSLSSNALEKDKGSGR